jgi:hypothetical protein
MLYPQLVTRVVVWNIVGGIFGTYALGVHYSLPTIQAVRGLGIKGLLTVPEWRERIADNPAKRFPVSTTRCSTALPYPR